MSIDRDRALGCAASVMSALVVIGLAAIAIVILAGCASAPPVHCPPLKPYTTLEQGVLADELSKDGPEAQAFIADYLALRAQCRAPATGK